MDLKFAARAQTFPSRIVCLSDEASELLYLLGEQDRIVGVSGFSTRPPEVRTKAKVSTFRDANCEAFEKLDPDLIITYSDVQAKITEEAIHRGLPVMNFNRKRSLSLRDSSVASGTRVYSQSYECDDVSAFDLLWQMPSQLQIKVGQCNSNPSLDINSLARQNKVSQKKSRLGAVTIQYVNAKQVATR